MVGSFIIIPTSDNSLQSFEFCSGLSLPIEDTELGGVSVLGPSSPAELTRAAMREPVKLVIIIRA